MAKKQAVDYMKFIPVGVLAVSMIAGYVTLKNDVANAKDNLKAYEIVQAKLTEDSAAVKISQARTETKMEAVLDILKEIKNKV